MAYDLDEDAPPITDEDRKKLLGAPLPLTSSSPPIRAPRDYPAVAAPDLGGAPPVSPSMPETNTMPAISRPAAPAEERLNSLITKGPPPVMPLHGWKKVLDTIGQVAAPNVEQRLRYGPQNAYEKNLGMATKDYEAEQLPVAAEQKQATEQRANEAETREEAAQKSKSGLEEAQTGAIESGVGKTPQETTLHDLMTGNQGAPRINPDTQKPYTYLEAYTASDPAVLAAKVRPPTAEADTARATQLRADVAGGKKLSPEDADWLKGHTQEKTIVPATTNILNQPDKASARSDKSFQYNQTALDKVRAPIDALEQRFGRLTDTLNQRSPQADALVGPELLTVMAGGQGSGVRMNEAEIARIVGGRSAWQDLQAAIQHWSTTPADARSITPAQDKQIRDLIQAVGSKMTAKQKVLEDAQNALLDSEDPKEHRKIVAGARNQLDSIDMGESGGATRVQQNSKGEFRYSTDGGKTWQMGKPPQ